MDYIALTIACLLAFVTIVSYLTIQNIINPITIFAGLWTVIIGLYSLRAFGIYQATNKALYIIGLGLFSFILGAVFPLIMKRRSTSLSAPIGIKTNTLRPNYYFLAFLNLVCLAYFMSAISQTISLLRSGHDYEYIHSFYLWSEESEIGGSIAARFLLNWLVWPTTLAVNPILAVVLQFEKSRVKGKKLFVITSIANLAAYVFVTGARISLAYFAVYYVIVFISLGKKITMNPRKMFVGLLGGVVILAALNYINVSRGHTSIDKTMYLYVSGCVPHLSEKLKDADYGSTMGVLSVYGFIKPFLGVVIRVFPSERLINLRTTIEAIKHSTQERIFIADGQRFNAFLTPFFYTYLDGGYVMTFVYGFLYGLICSRLFVRLSKNRSMWGLCVYLLILQGLIFSMIRLPFVEMRYVFSLAIVIVAFALGNRKTVIGFGE